MSFNISNLSNINIDGLTSNLYPHLNLFKNLIENENYDDAQTLLKSNDELCQYMVLLYAASQFSEGSEVYINPFRPITNVHNDVTQFSMVDNTGNLCNITISNSKFVITPTNITNH